MGSKRKKSALGNKSGFFIALFKNLCVFRFLYNSAESFGVIHC